MWDQGETIRQDKMDFRRLKFWAKYGKCLKISNTFLFLFSNKMLVIRAGIHNMVVRIANSEDPDQTATTKTLIRLLLQTSHEHLISSQSLPSKQNTGFLIFKSLANGECSGSSRPEVKLARESSRPWVNSAWCRFHCNL